MVRRGACYDCKNKQQSGKGAPTVGNDDADGKLGGDAQRALYLFLEGLLANHVREAQVAADTGDCRRVWECHQQAQSLLDSLMRTHMEISAQATPWHPVRPRACQP
jgi:hypothetical protein